MSAEEQFMNTTGWSYRCQRLPISQLSKWYLFQVSKTLHKQQPDLESIYLPPSNTYTIANILFYLWTWNHKQIHSSSPRFPYGWCIFQFILMYLKLVYRYIAPSRFWMKFLPNHFFRRMIILPLNVFPQEKRKNSFHTCNANMNSSVYCASHHKGISPNKWLQIFCSSSGSFFQGKLHCLEISGFKMPAALLWKE